MLLDRYSAVVVVDFEFTAPPGDRPRPVCLVARELRTGKVVRLWRDDLLARAVPPYDVGPHTLFVSFFASAELTCHAVLGWPMPENILDLYAEFRCHTNGIPPACGNGLVGACQFFGLDVMNAAHKVAMRELVLRGEPYTDEERRAIIDYCDEDVVATTNLLGAMAPHLDLDRALLRGSYMAAVARMEDAGIPVDTERLGRLRAGWTGIQDELIRRIDGDYSVFDGRSFRAERWDAWLERNLIPWPRLASGALDLSDETFRAISKFEPKVAPMRELRCSLSALRLEDLAVGSDGRNRTLLSPYRARTSRNQPSNTQYLFGPAVWLRGLILPSPGQSIAYVDWSQQEWGIAAALSGDPEMIAAYRSKDPYLMFAIQAGAAPKDATKVSHKAARERFKAAALAVQYGMGAESLAQRVGCSVLEARGLLADHRRTYRRFWAWSDAAVDTATLHGRIWTTFGWQLRLGPDVNPRSLRNFPVQGNGAEMLRIACVRATRAGVKVCAPVHDAVLIEAPTEQIDDAVASMQRHMAAASEDVLGCLELRSDVRIVRSPDRYMDERGARMWSTVWEILDGAGGGA